MAWLPPTYADARGVDPSNPVRCRCRRLVRADMLADMRPVPESARARLQRPDALFLCDACRETAFRRGDLDRVEYLRAVDAPAPVIAKARAESAGPG